MSAPSIELITVEAGDELFTKAGHGTICVRDAEMESNNAICFNYGVTSFKNPVTLSWQYLHGESHFWVTTGREGKMTAYYAAGDRTIWRQKLVMPDDQAEALARALFDDAKPENRNYDYHHFDNNCTTRIRDRLEDATGALRVGSDQPYGPTWRQLARHYLAGNVLFETGAELAGTPFDHHPSVWEAMAVPDVLREVVAERFDAKPEMINQRVKPSGGVEWSGKALILGLGVGTAGIAAAGRVRGPIGRIASGIAAVLLTIAGGLAWALPLLSTLGEAHDNWLLLAAWPTDVVLAGRWPWVRTYAVVRLLVCGIVVLVGASGLISQPIGLPAAMVGLVCAAAIFGRPDKVEAKSERSSDQA